MNTEVRVFPYAVRFGVAYAVALVLLAVVTTLIGIDSGAGSSIGSLIAAVLVAVGKFVKDHERVPNSKERRKLTWASLAASVLVSSALVAALLAATGQLNQTSEALGAFEHLSMGVAIGVFAFLLALYAVVIWFAYGAFAKAQYKSLQRRKSEI